MARRDVRAVMRAQHGSTEAASVEELESQLATMNTVHEATLAAAESEYARKMTQLSSGLVAESSSRNKDGLESAAVADLQHQIAVLQGAQEASRTELQASKQRELESAAEAQRLNNELVTQKEQAEEQQQLLSATMQSMSETFKKQAETAQSMQQTIQSSMSEAVQAAIDKTAAEKQVALGALEREVQALQSQYSEQMEEQMAEFAAAETGWQVAVEVSTAVTAEQITELEAQHQTSLDQLVSTGDASAASIQELHSELHDLQTKHTEAAQQAQQNHVLEIEMIESTHANAVAQLVSRLAEAERTHESLASAASQAESRLRSEIDEVHRREADLVASVLTSTSACEATEQSAAAQSSELQAMRLEIETQAANIAASATLSRQHTAAARIQAQHRRCVAQRDMRAIMDAQRSNAIEAENAMPCLDDLEAELAEMQSRHAGVLAIAESEYEQQMGILTASQSNAVGELQRTVLQAESLDASLQIQEHVAAATIQRAHHRRRAQRDMRQLVAQGVRSAAAASAAAETVGVLNTELHSARTAHADSLQAQQKDFEEVLSDLIAQHGADRAITEQDVRREMAWLSTRLSESEQAVAVAEQQRDAAFLYNHHNSAATVIQRFARTRSCRNATRVLLSQSLHRSTRDRNVIEALTVALTSSSDRLEVALSEVQTLLTEALSREEHTARLLNEERVLTSALREEAADKILETAAQTRSKLLAEHTARQTQQDRQHYAAATIQRTLRQRSALHDIRSVVRASQARLAQEQAEVLRGKAVLEETRDELATANAMNESALEQLALEIQNGRERAAAAKIQVCRSKLLSCTADSVVLHLTHLCFHN
eukprot:COSAG02_NODE_3531_length_6606_cov_67.718611_9_plen_834_part_01